MSNYLPIGIDPHRDTASVCILHPDRTVLKTITISTCSASQIDSLIHQAEEIASPLNLKPIFILEATNIFWRPIFSYLKRQGQTVHTVSSFQTHSFRKTNMRKTKTDPLDAKTVASLFLEGKSHPTKFPKEPLMSIRELTRLYSALVNMKASVLNRINGYIFQVFPEFHSVIPDKAVNTILTLMEKEAIHPLSIVRMRIDKLTRILKSASCGRFGHNEASWLKSAAKNTFGIPEGKEGFSKCLSILAKFYRYLKETLDSLENEAIAPLLRQVPHKFDTLKGMGIISTASFVSELGDPKDFPTADDALAWFGFDPAVSESAGRRKQGKHISKCGTKYGRESMFLAAGSCILHNPALKAKYKRLSKTRFWKDAKAVITADLIRICYAMYRDNAAFDPSRL